MPTFVLDIDLGKKVCSLVGLDEAGVVLRLEAPSSPLVSALSEGTVIPIIAVDGVSERIRLYGIYAPKGGQKSRYGCGKGAAAALTRLFDRGDLLCGFERTCRGTARHDLYGRILTACGVGKVGANDFLVRDGDAWGYHKKPALRA